jgi:PAS domain S-box-containing protein
MSTKPKLVLTRPRRLDEMQSRLEELEETLRAIRQGEVDALVVSGLQGDRVFTLQGADHPYRVILETINEGAATLAANGLVLYANCRFAEMVERPLENLIGSKLQEIVPILEWSSLDELLKRALTAPQREEGFLLLSGGRLLPANISLSPLKVDDFQGICMVVSDLTEQKSRQQQLRKANELLKAEIAERKRVEDALRQTEEVFQSFMSYSPAVVFMQDEEGRYTFCNKKVEEIVGIAAQDLIGKKSFDWVPGEAGRSMYERDLAALSGSEPTEVVETVPSPDGSSVEFLVVRFPFRDPSGKRLLGGVGIDITPQRRAEAALSRLSGRLLNMQDEERRRIARDLHDSTAQILTALSLSVASLQGEKGIAQTPRAQSLLAETVKLAQDASNEIRNLSHLLHPPDLDNVGLIAAVEWHSRQIREMTGIHIALEFPRNLGRLSQDIEIALFRIVQESLENVRRHSGSLVASVRLIREEGQIVLEIKDQGRGVPPGILTDGAARLGIGVAGMRERMRQLGGRLEIASSDRGTTVRATVPVPELSSDDVRDRQTGYPRAVTRKRTRVSPD